MMTRQDAEVSADIYRQVATIRLPTGFRRSPLGASVSDALDVLRGKLENMLRSPEGAKIVLRTTDNPQVGLAAFDMAFDPLDKLFLDITPPDRAALLDAVGSAEVRAYIEAHRPD